MDATTTHSIHSLIKTLKSRHSRLLFEEADEFWWSPNTETIFYSPSAPHAEALLIHELSHALLRHTYYTRDIELVAMETEAWDEAKKYIQTLTHTPVIIKDDIIQDHLDTYREWLHSRSTCPNCSANGYQTGPSSYQCPACTQTWRVNEARICALRRYKTN